MAVIGAAIAAIGGWLASGSIMATLAVNLMASTAVSALTAALNKPKARQPLPLFLRCQPASKIDPVSAPNFDPPLG